MGFTKFIQVGRVVYVASGPLKGRICAVVNIIDQNRVLVDGPLTGVTRQVINLKKVHVTSIRIGIPHTANTRMVRDQWKLRHVSECWESSLWCRKLRAKQKTQSLTDFERFKLRRLQKERNVIVNSEMKKVRTESKKKTADKKKKVAKKGTKKVVKKPVAK